MTNEAGDLLSEPLKLSPSGEAINGIACSGFSLAVSTRREIMLRTWTAATPDRWAVAGVPHGARGITAVPSGCCVAPLGRSGVMILQPTAQPDQPVGVITSDKERMYFYRVIALPGRDGQDLLVCAMRQGGIGITEVLWGQATYNLRVATFPGLDLVDVCAVGGPPEAPAVAGVGRDGSLFLVRDALRDKNPVTMRFDTVQGTAYRILSARGHIFVLTSRGLFGLMNLGAILVQGLPSGKFVTPVRVIPMEAVDANMVGDRWMLIVMADEVLKFDVSLIEGDIPQGLRNGEIRQVTGETLTPDWQVQRVQQKPRELAAV
jgi:hypothetical protein